MSTPQFVDVSSFQGSIDWGKYKQWASSFDGISRVAMKASEGTGFQDALFKANRAGALAVNISHILYYHYARPDLNNATNEANWFHAVVGPVRPGDVIMLDYEQSAPQSTSSWALAWLKLVKAYYPNNDVILYSYDSFIRQRLQDTQLTAYKLYLANFTNNPTSRPTCPPPWTSYEYFQYTDRATIPGIPTLVDADIFLGKEQVPTVGVPKGWSDNGVILTAPNGHSVGLGFRKYVLEYKGGWNPTDVPLASEEAVAQVENGFPSGAGSRQFFMYHELGYTPARGVYEISVGREAYIALHPTIVSPLHPGVK